MPKIDRATEKQIAFLTARGCPEEPLRELSVDAAWDLIKQIKKDEGTWKQWKPKAARHEDPAAVHTGTIGNLRYECVGPESWIHKALNKYLQKSS